MNLNKAVGFSCGRGMSGYRRGGGHWDKLLAKLAGEPAQRSLLCLEHLGFVLLQAVLDIVDALDHDAPEERGELASQRFVGDQAPATCGHASVEAAQGDVFATSQAQCHHAEEASGTIAASLDRPVSLATLVTAGSQSGPGREVLFGGPLGQVGTDFSDDLQDAVFGVRGKLGEILAAADLRKRSAQVGDIGCVDAGLASACRQRRRVGRRSRIHLLEKYLDAVVAFGDLALIVLPALQRLPEREQVLIGPGTEKGLLHALGFSSLDLGRAKFKQTLRITLAVKDGAHDSQAADAGQAGEGSNSGFPSAQRVSILMVLPSV